MLKNIIDLFRQIFNSKAGKSSLIYTFTNFFNAALPFLLLPLLTSKLNEAEYGITIMVMVLVSIVTPLLTLGVTGSIAVAYFKEEINNFPRYMANCLYITIGAFIVLGLGFYVFSNPIAALSEVPEKWIFSVLAISFLTFIIEMNLINYRIKFKSREFAIIKISQTIITFGLTYIMVVQYQLNWQGVIIAKLTSLSFFGLLSFGLLLKNRLLQFKVDKNYLKFALLFGLPLLPHLLSSFIISASDRLFITNILGVEETGSYTVAYQIGSIMELLCISFNLAWSPWLFSKLQDFESNRNLLRKITSYGLVGISLFAILLALLAPLIINIFVAESFKISILVINIIITGFVFQGFYLLFVNYLFYNGNTKHISIISVTVAFLNLFLNYIAIPKYGIVGAAIATLTCYMLKAIVVFFITNKKFPIYKLLLHSS